MHPWYTDWSWISLRNSDTTLFELMNDLLIDDCIREILKHVNVLDLIRFAHFNDRFMGLAEEKLSRLRVISSTVGTIGMMNFRYLLTKFGDNITELSISLNVFPSLFGFYGDETKEDVLRIILDLVKPQLKKIHFHAFNFSKNQNKVIEHFLKSLSERGTEIEITE